MPIDLLNPPKDLLAEQPLQDAPQEPLQSAPIEQPIEQPSNQITPAIDLRGAVQQRIAERQQNGWGRAAGLTARAVIEGAGDVYDLATSPIRYGMSKVGLDGSPGFIQSAADALDLPKPEHTQEKIISGAQKMLASGGGMVGLASKAAKGMQAGTVAQQAVKSMAARPDLQAASMVGAGSAGEYAKAEGAGPWGQLAASLAGGLAAPGTLAAGQKGFQLTKSAIDSMRKSPNINAQIDDVLNSAFKAKGVQNVPNAVRAQLHRDMNEALSVGEISPAAVHRLVDYRLTGATPTAGPVTLDPGVITKQQNIMRVGAASQDPKLQQLSQIASKNEQKLIAHLNDMGAGTVDDQIAAAERVMTSLDDVAATAKGKIDPLYKQARDTVGRSAKLDPRTFTQQANDALDKNLLGSKLPVDVRNNLNDIASGKMPFTVDVAEQLKTSMGKLARTTKDGQERVALGMVRDALENTPLLDGQGKAAIEAFRVARQANREWMQVVERTPALKAVMDGVEPDKFMNKYIIGQGKDASLKSVANLRNVIKDDVGAQTAIKNQISRYLKDKSLGGAADDVGRFSPANFNKTLKAIGDRKLAMFFNKQEIDILKAVGRVASYEKAQPTGSAVNNSNTAATAVGGLLDWLGSVQLLKRVPVGGQFVADQAQGASQSLTATQMLKVPQAITSAAKQAPKQIGSGAVPLAAAVSAKPSDND